MQRSGAEKLIAALHSPVGCPCMSRVQVKTRQPAPYLAGSFFDALHLNKVCDKQPIRRYQRQVVLLPLARHRTGVSGYGDVSASCLGFGLSLSQLLGAFSTLVRIMRRACMMHQVTFFDRVSAGVCLNRVSCPPTSDPNLYRSSLAHFHIVLRHRQSLSDYEPCRPEFCPFVHCWASAPRCRSSTPACIQPCHTRMSPEWHVDHGIGSKSLHSRCADPPIVLDSECSQNTPIFLSSSSLE